MAIEGPLANLLSSEWTIPLTRIWYKRPGLFCYACWCPWCLAYQQRSQLLVFTSEPYICCGGLFASLCCARPKAHGWLCVEVFFCLPLAIAGNRFFIQTRFDRKNSDCDRCLLWTTFLVACCTFIARCFVNIPENFQRCVNLLVICVNSCLLAQQQAELELIRQGPYAGVKYVLAPLIPGPSKPFVKLQPPEQVLMIGLPVNV